MTNAEPVTFCWWQVSPLGVLFSPFASLLPVSSWAQPVLGMWLLLPLRVLPLPETELGRGLLFSLQIPGSPLTPVGQESPEPRTSRLSSGGFCMQLWESSAADTALLNVGDDGERQLLLIPTKDLAKSDALALADGSVGGASSWTSKGPGSIPFGVCIGGN